jgi:hypothetical protein
MRRGYQGLDDTVRGLYHPVQKSPRLFLVPGFCIARDLVSTAESHIVTLHRGWTTNIITASLPQPQ